MVFLLDYLDLAISQFQLVDSTGVEDAVIGTDKNKEFTMKIDVTLGGSMTFANDSNNNYDIEFYFSTDSVLVMIFVI